MTSERPHVLPRTVGSWGWGTLSCGCPLGNCEESVEPQPRTGQAAELSAYRVPECEVGATRLRSGGRVNAPPW